MATASNKSDGTPRKGAQGSTKAKSAAASKDGSPAEPAGEAAAPKKAKPATVPAEAIKIELFGDLMKFTKKPAAGAIAFKKYDILSTNLAVGPREERLLLYPFLCGLALTAHARRMPDVARRKEIFDLKNALFIAVANNFNFRRVLNFRIGVSRRFKVVEYCPDCTKGNKEAGLAQRDWKFCRKCRIDKGYFNVLSMYHRYEQGGASLFLGRELIPEVKGLKDPKSAPFSKLKEELVYKNFHFSPKNLLSLDLKSVMDCSRKIIALMKAPGPGGSAPSPGAGPGGNPGPAAPGARG